MNAFSHFAESSLSDRLADEVVPNESIVRNFLATLRCLPVTFFAFLLLELGERSA